MAFELALTRLNDAVAARVSNAWARLDGGEPLRVVYTSPSDVALDLVAVQRPRVGLPYDLVQDAVAEVSTLEIVDGDTFTVETIEPDGAGWAVLQLKRAA